MTKSAESAAEKPVSKENQEEKQSVSGEALLAFYAMPADEDEEHLPDCPCCQQR